MRNLIVELREQVDKIDAIDDNITDDQYVKFNRMVTDMVAFARDSRRRLVRNPAIIKV